MMEINGKYCRKLNSWPLSLTTLANWIVAILQRCQFARTLFSHYEGNKLFRLTIVHRFISYAILPNYGNR